ncbi:MAG: hypothetical protein BroJett029_24070 [Alphaproteobacteria bacterium]|nr:MAG: hypothetical protein BroJett029_24070 [Alphaproteobacteria bacterium]
MTSTRAVSQRLNRECFCITLDRESLAAALAREAGDPDFYSSAIAPRPNLFSNTPVFLPEPDIAAMLRVVRAIEAATRLPGYREAALSWAPEITQLDFGPLGAFMGYDFHLTDDGPKLIEVNTNAGGAFLNALLAEAQRACCTEVEVALRRSDAGAFETAVLSMFETEWKLQRGTGRPGRVAIVDDRPEEQYLYPEFLLARRFFQKHGIDALIADAAQLRYEDRRLLFEDRPIDLVYNRLVDFSFGDPAHAALRAAYMAGAAVVTPNPRAHALFADKRNMTLFSDPAALRSWGLPPAMVADLAGVPRTVLVGSADAQELWAARKRLFFKPARGHAGKAVYRGDKVTRSVWSEILRGDYVAQEFAAPGERMIERDGTPQPCKADVRLYIYDGEILLTAARLYQGQTTNFRTPGGGFAPVFPV